MKLKPRGWLLLAALTAACAGPSATTNRGAAAAPTSPWLQPTFPGTSWETIPEPELVGFTRKGLDSASAYLATIPTTGLVVMVHGRLLFQYGNISQLSYLASVRKSVLSMLFGRYVSAGVVDLEKNLAQLGIDDRGGLLPSEREATVRDLISARSGVFHLASNSGDFLDSAPARGAQRHGAYFLYSNWDFNALGTIFELTTGRNIYDALEVDLAIPLGMEDWRREVQRKSGDTTRSRHLAYHIWFSTRDMARIGYLMLRRGKWRERQLIPESWIDESTRLVTRSSEMNPSSQRELGLGYGYLWWILERERNDPLHGAYAARGAYGQYILVIPRLDMVIAHKRAVDPQTRTSVSWEQFLKLVDIIVRARAHPERVSKRAR